MNPLPVPSSRYSQPPTPPPPFSRVPVCPRAQPQTVNAGDVHFLMVIPVGPAHPEEKTEPPVGAESSLSPLFSFPLDWRVWAPVQTLAPASTQPPRSSGCFPRPKYVFRAHVYLRFTFKFVFFPPNLKANYATFSHEAIFTSQASVIVASTADRSI